MPKLYSLVPEIKLRYAVVFFLTSVLIEDYLNSEDSHDIE